MEPVDKDWPGQFAAPAEADVLSTRYFTLNCSTAKRPHELVTEEDLPATWDWWVLLVRM
jgi:hypothetical protein